LDLIT